MRTAASARTWPAPRLRSSISSTARARRSSVARRTSSVESAVGGRADRFAGARQQVAARIDDGDVLRPQAGHRGGDQIERSPGCPRGPVDRRRPWSASRWPARPGARARTARARGSTRCTRTPRMPCMARMVRASLALQRAGLVDLLLEFGGGEAVGAIEDLVADRAAGGQALTGQRQPRLGHLFGRHQDLTAVGAEAIGDVAAGELIDHLGRNRAGRGRRRAGPSARCRRAAPSAPAYRACRVQRRPSRRAGLGPGLAAHPRGPSSLSPLRPRWGRLPSRAE